MCVIKSAQLSRRDLKSETIRLSDSISEEELIEIIEGYNQDPSLPWYSGSIAAAGSH